MYSIDHNITTTSKTIKSIKQTSTVSLKLNDITGIRVYNLNKENALYFIQDDLKDKFYNLITYSYLNQIRKKDKNYTDNFYNICKKKISYIKIDLKYF